MQTKIKVLFKGGRGGGRLAGEMAQQLRVLTALTEDTGSVPCTSIVAL